MKVSDLVAPVIEPVEDRYDRDLLNLNDDRKVRGFDYQAAERRSREFVDPATGETVSATGDNDPVGFDKAAFENSLVYNPNTDGEDEDPDPEDPDTGDGDGGEDGEEPEQPEEPETP